MPRAKGTPHKIDISGQRFGSWIVLRRILYANWECRCDCGTVRVVQGSSLKLGTSTGCQSCLARRNTKHGMEGTRTYNTWAQMKRRCLNPTSAMYIHYGARGITICDRWHEFAAFFADMGEAPHRKSLGRIDNNGPYSPENCRWETPKQQMRNRRNTSFVLWHGEKRSVAEIAEEHRMPIRLVRDRLSVGWSIEKAVSLPSRKYQE